MATEQASSKWLLAVDPSHLARSAAKIVLESVISAVEARNLATLAVSGGTTPKMLFDTLVEDYFRSRIPWSRVHIFWADERCVPPQHAESNFGTAKTALLSKVSIPEVNIHRMHGETTPPADAAKAYENELKAFFKVDKSLPIFDLILLGVGSDGHTASLFPRTEALEENQKLVVASFVEKLKANRLTLTFPVLNAARRVMFLAEGKEKAPILREVLSAQTSSRYPAQRVQPTSGELIWMFDRAAASELPNDIRYKAFHMEGGNRP